MSIQPVDWGRCEVLDNQPAKPDGLRFPDEWTLSERWRRAQTEHSDPDAAALFDRAV